MRSCCKLTSQEKYVLPLTLELTFVSILVKLKLKQLLMRVALLLVLTAMALCLSAQSRKGQLLLAGDTKANALVVGGFGNNQLWDIGTSRIGYFVSDEILVGVEASLRTNLFAFQTPEDLRINPFLRYYFTELHRNKFGYFLQFGVGTFGAFSDFGQTANFETDFYAGFGAEYAVAPNLLAEGFLRYNAKASILSLS